MKIFAWAIALAPGALLAAWGPNPLVLADQGNDQVQVKIKTAPDGTTYVGWFDNRAGGYDPYLQRLDRNGNELWAHNGVLVADRSVSSTQDWDLALDTFGNAYVIFNDDRVSPAQVTVQKVSPTGSLEWGPSGFGISVSTSSASKGNPKVCVLESGTIVTAWTETNTIKYQRLNSLGVTTGATSTWTDTGRALSLCDLEPGDGDNVNAMWIRGTGTNIVTSSKHLYAQKYNANFVGQWNGGAPFAMFDQIGISGYGTNGSSVQTGYFPTITSDGEGGFVAAWYETGGPRNAYLQHVLSDGTEKFGSNGVATTGVDPIRIRIGASLAYDRWSGNYYVASEESSSPSQGNYTVIAQKLNRQGIRQWTDAGVTVQGINGNQKSFVQAVLSGDGLAVFGFDGRPPVSHVVFKSALKADGTEDYGVTTQLLVDPGVTTKGRLFSTFAPNGDALLGWTDSSDIWAQRIGAGGRAGNGATQLTGNLTTPDYFGLMPGVNWMLTIEQGATVEKHLIRADDAGNWSCDTDLVGIADVTLDGTHWTKQREAGITLGAATLTYSMVNGDVDDSGEVDAADIDIVIANFGGVVGTLSYNINADVDGSGEIDAADIDLVIANFGATDE